MNETSRKHVDAAVEKIRELEAWEGEIPEDARLDLKDFSQDELEAVVVEGLGEKKFRAQQLQEWMYRHLVADFAEMTNLSKALRARLDRIARLSPVRYKGEHSAEGDKTSKLTFECDDGAVIESVYIPSNGRNTLCISSQVGCAMGCTFCYTAKMGLRRNLSTAEIVQQVVEARRRLTERNGHIGNIVFMGMGEPMHNYDNVVRAVHILVDQEGLDFSKRRVTVSTSGLVPQIEQFGRDTDVQLAISLNATTDETRSKIMPINDRWGLDDLMEVLRNYPLENRERITFEYVLLEGVNDSLEDAERIARLIEGIPAKVNIIPFNPHPKTPFRTPTDAVIEDFQDYLAGRGVTVLRRATRGRDSMAACGQLGKPGDRKVPAHLRKRLEQFRAEAAQSSSV